MSDNLDKIRGLPLEEWRTAEAFYNTIMLTAVISNVNIRTVVKACSMVLAHCIVEASMQVSEYEKLAGVMLTDEDRFEMVKYDTIEHVKIFREQIIDGHAVPGSKKSKSAPTM